jgi:hypothetical protein
MGSDINISNTKDYKEDTLKAISECWWSVGIRRFDTRILYWWAFTDKENGVDDLTQLDTCETKQEAKKDWEEFAALNNIKNWKYV